MKSVLPKLKALALDFVDLTCKPRPRNIIFYLYNHLTEARPWAVVTRAAIITD